MAVNGGHELRDGVCDSADHVCQPGLRAGMVAGVIVNRTQQEIPNAETMKQTESHAVKIVVEAARRLL